MGVLEKLDFLLSWWERAASVPWIKTGIAVVAFCLFKIGAEVSGQLLIIQLTVALASAASMTVLFALAPLLLRKLTHPPFQVSASSMLSSKYDIQIPVSIINKSPKSRLVLDFAVCLRSADQHETWFLEPEVRGIDPGLGPQEQTKGMVVCSSFHGDLPERAEVFLRVTDHLSSRRLFFKVPN